MEKFKKYLGVTLVTTVILLAAVAYFFESFSSGMRYDGLGRRLYETPWWAYYLGGGYQWSGIYWHVIDLIVFWGGLITGWSLIDSAES